MPECYIRGSTIKYLRIPDEVIDMVKEEVQQKSKGRGEMRGRGSGPGSGPRGRGAPSRGNLCLFQYFSCDRLGGVCLCLFFKDSLCLSFRYLLL